MQQIQARMQSLMPQQEAPGAFPSVLQGAIGTDNAPKPLNPFAQGQITPEGEGKQFSGMIQDAALQNNVDPLLFDCLVSAESSYNPNCRSSAGAMGLTQLMPETAKSMGVTNPFDPAQNLAGGAKYFRGLLDKFGDVRSALAAYNAGPGAVHRYGGVPPYKETQDYVAKIMNLYEARRRP
ncbi:MAG: lytic transglycosylase domain-containing protein [Armatimonadetes bacterium]|nr:lytic transglycosylase domain-containing protein [Armatimonadota bacterium]